MAKKKKEKFSDIFESEIFTSRYFCDLIFKQSIKKLSAKANNIFSLQYNCLKNVPFIF